MLDRLLITGDHPVLKNHVVHGQLVLPGLAYLDLLYQYLRGRGHAFDEWELRDLSIYDALVVGAEEGVLLHFAESPGADGSLHIRIDGSPHPGSADAVRRRYVTVRACRVGVAEYSERIDRDAVKASSAGIDTDDVYEIQKRLGLVHGDFMKVRGTIHASGKAVYVDAQVSGQALSVASEVLFHPALLDGAAVCCAVGSLSIRPLAGDFTSRLSVPVYIESFRARAPLRASCTVRLQADSMRSKGGASYSTLEFFDAQGQKIAELRNVASTTGLTGTAGAEIAGPPLGEGGGSALRMEGSPGAVPVARFSVAEPQRSAASPTSGAALVEAFLLAELTRNIGELPVGFTADTSFAAAGLSSLALVKMLQVCEARIGEPLSPIMLFECANVRELASHLASNYGAIFVRPAATDEPEAAAPSPATGPPGEAQSTDSSAAKVEAFLLEQLRASLGALPEGFDASTSFAASGLDSGGMLKMLQAIEARVGEPLSPIMLFECGNVRELASSLVSTYGAAFATLSVANERPADQPAAAAPLAAAAAASNPTAGVEAFLLAKLGESVAGLPQGFDASTSFAVSGLDSGGMLGLLQAIEAKIGEPLSPIMLFECGNVRELASHLATNYGVEAFEREAAATPAGNAAQGGERPPESAAVRATSDLESQPAQPATVPAIGGTPPARSGDVAIIGLAGRFPRAPSMDALWERLREGADCVTEVPADRWDRRKNFKFRGCCRWGGFLDDVDKYDATYFNIEPNYAVFMDPQERLFLETVWHLLENAGYTRERLRAAHGGRVGVYVGSMYKDYSHIESEPYAELMAFPTYHATLANRVSHFFDLHGPSMAIDTLCSSAAVGICNAYGDLRDGDCEVAIVGGVNLCLHPRKFQSLSLHRQLGSHENSRSFADGDGYLPAEACGAVLLKPLARAVEDGDNVLAVLKGAAINHGGRSNAYGVPNPNAQALVIERCLSKAGVDAGTVSYVEASANGSSLGDPIELAALERAFAKHSPSLERCAIGSVKSNLGHAEAASAITQLAKVVLQLEHGELIPSIRTEPPNPHTKWNGTPFHLVRELREWQRPVSTVEGREQEHPRRALLNSFGAGGTNVAMLLEEFRAPPRGRAPAPPFRAEVIVLSARNAERLAAVIGGMADFVAAHPEVELRDIAYTLQIGREAMRSRVALVVRSREELLAGLASCSRSDFGIAGRIEANVPAFFGETAEVSSGAGAAVIEAAAHDDSTLAQEWTRGAAVEWRSRRFGNERVVALPNYPFRRDRYWFTVPPLGSAPQRAGAPETSTAATRRDPRGAAPVLDPNRDTFVAPRNALERSIVGIWEEVLEVRNIGATDNFFDLGGNSMLAGLVLSRCNEAFNVRIDLPALLGGETTPASLAVAIVAELAAAQDVEPADLETVMEVG
jgi:3-oxoacyl-(acyl-carrier-protein) synthase/acyl carrier protein